MKGNKLYNTKEMKADSFEPSVSDVKEASEVKVEEEANSNYTISVKRGRYYVHNVEGVRLGKFNHKRDADNFIKEHAGI